MPQQHTLLCSLMAPALLALSACSSDDPPPQACVAVVSPAVRLNVVDDATGADLTAIAQGEILDYSLTGLAEGYLDPLVPDGARLSAGLGREGVFDVRVRVEGYSESSVTGVNVTTDACGVVTRSLTARMRADHVGVRAPSAPVTETASLATAAGCGTQLYGWSGRQENGVVVVERLRAGCSQPDRVDQVRIWVDPSTNVRFANHRVVATGASGTGPEPGLAFDAAAGLDRGQMGLDSFDPANIVSMELIGLSRDGREVALVVWADMNR